MDESSRDIVPIEPYRLDLTVSALRRVATNPVDRYTANGDYYRAISDRGNVAVIRVRQNPDGALTVVVTGDPTNRARAEATARSVLGVDRSVAIFADASRQVPWLAALVDRFRGLRPPRYPSIWEAFVNAVIFQQVSLHSASAITRRLILALAERVEVDGRPLYVFPDVDRFHLAPDAPLRAAGLSANKLTTLRAAAERIRSGAISADRLDELSSEDAGHALQAIRGIGPWTAAVILLRGMGRLDVFPPNDSGVNANIRRFADAATEMQALLEALGEQRGMLYFYLLMGRLDAEGRLGEPSIG